MSDTTPQNLVATPIPQTHAIARLILTCGDLFAHFDSSGSFRSGPLDEEGLYFDGTRFLSRKYIQVNGLPLSVLGTQVRSDGEELFVTYSDLANATTGTSGHSLSISERMFLSGESCYAEIVVTNFLSTAIELSLSIHLDADYADIYEVRGMRRNARGSMLKSQVSGAEIILGYEGLDREIRSTQIAFTPSPSRLGDTLAEFDLRLTTGESTTLYVVVTCSRSLRASSLRESHAEAHAGLGSQYREHPHIFLFDSHIECTVQCLVEPIHVGPSTPYYLGVNGKISLCRGALVQHSVRTRWPDYGA